MASQIAESIRQSSLRESKNPQNIQEAIALLDVNNTECALQLATLQSLETQSAQETYVLKCFQQKLLDNEKERKYLDARLVELTKS